jgi:hypothetical protein
VVEAEREFAPPQARENVPREFRLGPRQHLQLNQGVVSVQALDVVLKVPEP